MILRNQKNSITIYSAGKYRLLKNFRTEYWTIWTGEGTVGGGFMKKADDFEGGQSVVLYIDVDNIDEALAEVEKAGGKIVTPTKLSINESSRIFRNVQ